MDPRCCAELPACSSKGLSFTARDLTLVGAGQKRCTIFWYRGGTPHNVALRLTENGHIVILGIDYVHQLQWPAMVVTVLAAWLIASQAKRKRVVGFWLFLLSNILWITWGCDDRAYALVALQIALAILNFRGVYKNEPRSVA